LEIIQQTLTDIICIPSYTPLYDSVILTIPVLLFNTTSPLSRFDLTRYVLILQILNDWTFFSREFLVAMLELGSEASFDELLEQFQEFCD
jgi:hypothetical protein